MLNACTFVSLPVYSVQTCTVSTNVCCTLCFVGANVGALSSER